VKFLSGGYNQDDTKRALKDDENSWNGDEPITI
jgi:hypothetical protein